jgi:IS5 family transposase
MDSEACADDLDYARGREANERAAAKSAPTVAARRAHQEVAQYFAKIVHRPAGRSRVV